MADIMEGEQQKRVLRLLIYLGRKKLGKCASVDAIHEDMMNCSHQLYQIVAECLNETASKFDTPYHNKVTSEYGELGLWIMYKDTAWREAFVELLAQLFERKEIIEPLIKEYRKPKEKWYTNLWWNSRNKTKKLRESGEIPRYGKSHEESIFTPEEQAKRLSKIK